MTQLFKGDDKEKKFFSIFDNAFVKINLALGQMYADTYNAYPLGAVLFDNKLTPLTNAIPRQTFIENFNTIFNQWAVAGTFESYLIVFKHIFGENSIIEFERTAPKHLTIDITANRTDLFNFLTRTQNTEDDTISDDDIIDDVADRIVFQRQIGIENFNDVIAVLNSLKSADSFITVNFSIQG